jgi:hypothetical protein
MTDRRHFATMKPCLTVFDGDPECAFEAETKWVLMVDQALGVRYSLVDLTVALAVVQAGISPLPIW